jgi:hypothetical protein
MQQFTLPKFGIKFHEFYYGIVLQRINEQKRIESSYDLTLYLSKHKT